MKNATLIGTNLQILNDVEMIGNDLGIFLGSCGKDGQFAPVTAGSPDLQDPPDDGGRSGMSTGSNDLMALADSLVALRQSRRAPTRSRCRSARAASSAPASATARSRP